MGKASGWCHARIIVVASSEIGTVDLIETTIRNGA